MNQNLKRIFVALPISLEFQNEILKFQKKFKNLNTRWIDGKNLHLTLVPPWYEKDINLVLEKLKSLEGQFVNFKIRFNLIELGPNQFNPRLIWAVGDRPKELLNLRLKILEVLNQKPENREFKTHLTLARFNSNQKFNNLKIKENFFWEEEFREFVLMESHLLKSGAEYEVLERIKLEKND